MCAWQERNPEALLQPFMTTLASKGLGFQQALFVPPESSYRKLGATEQQHNKDLSWQQGLQKVYQTHLTASANGVSTLTFFFGHHSRQTSCCRHIGGRHIGRHIGM